MSSFKWKIRRGFQMLVSFLFGFFFLSLLLILVRNPHWINQIQQGIEILQTWGPILLAFIVFLILGIKAIIFILKQRQLRRADISSIDKMNGYEFEEYLSYLFKLQGYKAKRTKRSGDFGADIIMEKDGIKTAVQAKRYRNKVDIKAIQDVVAAQGMYKTDRVMVVTNSYYTSPAMELARANQVELWDRNRLVKELSKMNMKDHRREIVGSKE